MRNKENWLKGKRIDKSESRGKWTKREDKGQRDKKENRQKLVKKPKRKKKK